MRNFKVGDLCVHKKYICRVETVEPNSTKGYNPLLTLIALYGPNNEPVKNAKPRKDYSGAVEYVDEAIKKLKSDIKHAQDRLALLE